MSKFYKVYHLGCLCWEGEASNHKAALDAGIASNEALGNEAASLSQHRFQKQFQRVRDAHSVRGEYKATMQQKITIHNHSSGWQTLLNGAHVNTHATQEEATAQAAFLVRHELGHAALKIDCRGTHGTLKVTISAE